MLKMRKGLYQDICYYIPGGGGVHQLGKVKKSIPGRGIGWNNGTEM